MSGASGEFSLLLTSSQRTILYDEPSQFPDGMSIPLSIFSSSLSGLQAIVRYLHDHKHLSFSKIAALLNRSEKTVWSSYQQGKRAHFSFIEEGMTIPVAAFATRELSVLETLVDYLAALGFSNIDSSRLLALDSRTIWTVRRRAAKKRGVRL